MPDEVRLAALRCLILLLPLDRHAPRIHDTNEEDRPRQDWEKVVPFMDDRRIRTARDDMTAAHLLESGNQSVVGRLVIIFLETAADATLVSLRITALEGLMKLVRVLPTPAVLNTWLPGILSGLTRVILARGLKENHTVLATALDTWTYCVIFVLGMSSASSPASGGSVGSTAQSATTGEFFMKMYKEKQSSMPESEKSTRHPFAVMYGTTAWFKKILGALKTLFRQIANVRSHSHWNVRLGFGHMSFRILRECQGPIAQYGDDHSNGVTGFLLETLVGCSRDEYEQVYVISNYYLRQLTEEFRTLGLSNIAKEIMREKLLALPRVLHGPDESQKQEAIKLAIGLAVFLGPEMERMINHQNLWGYVQSWINVLTIEQLDQHNVDGRGGILGIGAKDSATATGTIQTAEEQRWNNWVNEAQQSSPVRKFGFPRKIMLHLREQATSSGFLEFLRQVGWSTEINTWSEELISRLQQDARAVRENQGWFDSRSVSTVVLMNQLLLGATSIGLTSLGDTQQLSTTSGKKRRSGKEGSSSKKKHQRHVRKVARGVLEEYLAVLMESSILAQDAKNRYEDTGSRSATHKESEDRKKSTLAQFLTIEEGEGFDFDAQENKIYDLNTDIMLKCVLLEGIASIAVILGGTEFEMELVRVLYVLLERLGDQDSALVRDTAQATLEHIAFICQYQTIGDLIQANYDYVIQQVSQRIAFLSSNPKTPQVLWSLIHVVGPPAVSMLEDSVIEIFEALDHWKNQEDEVAEGLLKSLNEIVKVMALAVREKQSKEPNAKRDSGVQLFTGVEISLADTASKEVAEFVKGYQLLTQGIDLAAEDDQFKKNISNMTPEQIKEYFLQREKEIKEQEERLLGTQIQEVDDEDWNGSTEADDESVSFGDLRAQMPPPSKESKPEPPTKHQALCLRILDKAGYFLTASSPRMRVLALETIQSSIVVLKDRPQELNPAIFEMWPSIVNRILQRSEMEVFYVRLRAIELVTLLAENCSGFLSRHFLGDVWPFILRTLRTWTRTPPQAIKDHRVRMLGKTTVYQSTKSIDSKIGNSIRQRSVQSRQRRQATKVLTKEHRLQLTTLESVSKIVRKIQVPVQELWEMLLLARDIVRDQYWVLHWDVRMAAVDVIKSMALTGHGDSVWLVVSETVEELEALCEGPHALDKDKEDEVATKTLFADVLEFLEVTNV
ncbi:TEL2-interacting protein 1 [Podila epicladia]|nr:TEL2-interacting protein 1 [Podila epicladia]